jgi:hypothetical protein
VVDFSDRFRYNRPGTQPSRETHHYRTLQGGRIDEKATERGRTLNQKGASTKRSRKGRKAPKRTAKQQQRHDRKVIEIALRLKFQGWSVQADIPGFERPGPIGRGKYVPDVRATKAGAVRIIEVETPETVESDAKQHEAFRRSAAQKPRTTFRVEET